MSGFSFPILSNQELLPCLKEMDLPLTGEQISKPTFEILQRIYEILVTTLLGVTREELQQPVFMAIDTLEYPELHDESIPTLAFIKSLNRLLVAAGIKDFNMQQDLYKPDSNRLRRNLSGIINFAKFREEKLVPYTDMQESVEHLLEETAELEELNMRLTAEVSKLEAERAAEEPAVSQLEAETQQVFQENQQLNKQSTLLNNDVRTLKQQNNALADEASSAKFKLVDAQQEQLKLKGQIVESPERLQARLEELAGGVEKERALVTDAERRSRDLQARMDTIAKVEKEVVKAIRQMEEVEVEVKKKKEVSSRVKQLRKQVSANQAELQELEATEQHLKRQQASLTDRLSRLENQSALKREAAVSAVEEQLKEREAINAENAAARAKIAENEAMMRTLRERMKELQNNHDAQVSIVLEKYQSLRRQVQQYHELLEAAIAPNPGNDVDTASLSSAVKAITLR
ncbi:hypothetical protein WJX82_002463 [Trebouxia sp. C0006]